MSVILVLARLKSHNKVNFICKRLYRALVLSLHLVHRVRTYAVKGRINFDEFVITKDLSGYLPWLTSFGIPIVTLCTRLFPYFFVMEICV